MSATTAGSGPVGPVTEGAGAHGPRRARASLRAADGVRIDAAYEPGPGPVGGPVVVLAHGFTGDLDRPHVRRAAHALARHAAVVTFSFRGHGRSGGRSTVGDSEVLDLAAAVTWARSLGHSRVITLGFSMGGSVVLRHAGLHGLARLRAEAPGTARGTVPGTAGTAPGTAGAAPLAGGTAPGTNEGRTEARGGAQGAETSPEAPAAPQAPPGPGPGPVPAAAPAALPAPLSEADRLVFAGGRADRTDLVIAVSSPARWYYRGTAPMRRLHWLVTRRLGRTVGRLGFRTRIRPGDWDPVPLSPTALAPYIAPVPLLLVHGDRDPYFPLDHPRALQRAAGTHGELWIERGMGHAENATDEALLGRLWRWAERTGGGTGA
ncbi:alpha/beta hydrolase [Streptomyces sp. NEAU-H3]|uniref:alpha/beta hydrolase n=1 Tax=Streptomyces sp. NEAU-H3 TaxID=2720636 RepID=UPI00143A3193|nr:alpha/beta hydrolase [Streptomyces sp. NEAU-H3]NJA56191.1 alpha/beta fold hydrolase [Streptomyces sp. NEAU-H3]